MQIQTLENGAVELLNFDLEQVTLDQTKELRELLLQELIIVIREQTTDPVQYAKLAAGIGTNGIAFWQQMNRTLDGDMNVQEQQPDPWTWDRSKPFPVQRVTGELRNGDNTGIFPTGKLDWHCNVHRPEDHDGVALQGIHGVEGTRTSWLNTNLALQRMPDELRNRIRDVRANFRYSPLSWADIENEAQRNFMLNRENPGYSMFIEQENASGVKGIYLFTENECEIPSDPDLKEVLREYLFQEQFMYHHDWAVGDIVLSEQLLTMHKRRQEEDDVFRKRLLSRITFDLSTHLTPERNR